MTNLTSEQYRDVLKHVPGCTEEIPTVQHLLRRAVQTFFKRFRGYPELAGVAPGKIGLLGDHTQFNGGLALPAATPMATIVVGRRAPGTRFTVVTSADVGKPHKVNFSFSRNRPLGPGCPTWLNYVKGVIDNYQDTVPPFEAAIESSVPMGVGFGSSSAIEVATYSFLEVLVGKKADPIEKAKLLQKAEKEFARKEVGLVDRITSILAKDRHVMLIDCKTNQVMWIPFRNSQVTLVAVNSHLKDELFGDEYPESAKYLIKACEILGVETLRHCTEEHLQELESKVNEILGGEENEEREEDEDKEEEEKEGEGWDGEETETWTKEEYDVMIKRVRFFITEMQRINQAMEAWNEGDVETFGGKLTESHKSLKEDFNFNNPVLDFLVETSLEVEGVLGSRMTGMGLGFGGGIVSLVRKENVEKYCKYMTEKFAEHGRLLSEELKETIEQEKQRQYEIRKKFHSEHFTNPTIASSKKIGQVQECLKSGRALTKEMHKGLSSKRGSVDQNGCFGKPKTKTPCIVKVEKPKGRCGTWAHFQEPRNKEEFFRKLSLTEDKMKSRANKNEVTRKSEVTRGSEVSRESEVTRRNEVTRGSEVSRRNEVTRGSEVNVVASKTESEPLSEIPDVALKDLSFYIISPFAGARMMFVTKADILRSLYAEQLPHPNTLVRSALKEFETTYGGKVEAIGLAPTTVCLFGEFMEFHLGYKISMTLPMYVVMVGGRNDTVFFSVKTTSNDVENPPEMKYPVPSVRAFEIQPRSWVNFVMGVVSEFRGHVPGFNAVIHSSAPMQVGLHTCASLQASVYTYLENLTKECTPDPFEKADRCNKSEIEFLPTPTELISRCTAVKFLPIFVCKEGHLMFINCKNYKISQYFFDDPSYAFLIAICKRNTTDVTLQSLDKRLKECMEALDILDRKSLLFLEEKHLRCLKKRDASEEVIKRAKYVITEHQRTTEVIKALKEEDYPRVGLLMNQSHASLRDDYEISSPEIEALINLAMSAEGVLGAKMIGTGLNASIIILLKLSDADKCIRYMRKNYKDKSDKPSFYITKPAGGAFAMNPADVPYIL